MWKFVAQACVSLLLVAGPARAVSPADPEKVIHFAIPAADDGFDMVRTPNYYSGVIAESIYETLLTYDYLASPAKLVPKVAEAMPEVSDGGKTYTFHLKKGIFFTDDPAFKGKPRELTAQDFAYSFRRLLDPANRSPSAGFLQGKIVGMDAVVAAAKKSGKFDYDAPVTGLQTPDRYTLQISLNAPDYNFPYVIAYVALAGSAREVIDAYGLQSGQHPVGTGAYMLERYVPRSKIILVANPGYRGSIWNFEPSSDPMDQQIVRDMKGKKMPQVGRIEVSVIEEEQARWLAFQDKQIDIDWVPQLAARTVLDGTKLKPEFVAQKIRLQRFIEPAITYTFFNMHDPIVGGYSDEKNALRRAIAMSYNNDDDVTLIRHGQAINAEMIIPPGVVGYDPNYRSSIGYDPVLANKLLDHFGYKRGPDGYRTLPDGKPLKLKINREASVIYQELAELWKRGLDEIGIRAEHPVSNFADNLKAATKCELMMWGGAWSVDYPDGENFLQLLYGPNAHQGNNGCYESPAYDALFKKAITLPPGAERTALYLQMNRQMEADTAWKLGVMRVRNWVSRPWVLGFKKHPLLHTGWEYIDVDKRLADEGR
ncbi:ABC transporter substrate-binding protein [Actimicrobium sp. CCI2.3]|uniref:ABC transporter substrate-binding protein n=1 Tax=Actimicrobium sp. CCI2.3 TaxID=3048616 RepID=UPI002AB35AD8|nr:ABC transporter substrate-binding protein [Actimicrobium sp. CCI2.3]MDY7576209.1 ABC transporter substrate-binding protein [Actimicrobium sp. CCI2.3]MEB0020586.1 ABC transporter substrate-binding protein [Actimicrobium sp. CCI2.3]